MSVYNGQEFLRESIDSILNQTFTDLEFIIVDDGSTDNSKGIIDEYTQRDNRIFFFQNEKNIGLSDSLNKAIVRANGNYIARQDADDVSHSERLTKQYATMEAYQSIALLGTLCDHIDIENTVFEKEKGCEAVFENVIKNKYPQKVFSHGTAFIKAEILKKIGGYNPYFWYAQDLELWCRFYFSGYKIAVLQENLYRLRKSYQTNKIKLISQREYYHYLQNKYLNISNNEILAPDEIYEGVCERIKNKEEYLNKYYKSNYWFTIAKKMAIDKNTKYFFKYLFKAITYENRITIKIFKIAGVLFYFMVPYRPMRKSLQREIVHVA